jgi:hypothetical protein
MPESKRFLLRLNPDLFEALRRWADEDLRSINAQIEYLLTDQARRAGRLKAKRTPRPQLRDEDILPPEDTEPADEAAEAEESRGRKRRSRTRSSA